ncbi:MAG: hypothetical protein BWY71_00413 [Planctomycetes bacterium ADurb.Bin412]|nr:MAG: hypothetical protein BWY71_00413 [Planctomycetes bacterium ADurb.Bin412]
MPDRIPENTHRIIGPADLGQRLMIADKRRMHPQGKPLGGVFGNRQQLHGIAQFATVVDIRQLNPIDALHRNLLIVNLLAEGQAGQNRQLVRTVGAADIQGGVRFGISG